jgi:hypothetical protein
VSQTPGKIRNGNKAALFRYNCGLIGIGGRLEIIPDIGRKESFMVYPVFVPFRFDNPLV